MTVTSTTKSGKIPRILSSILIILSTTFITATATAQATGQATVGATIIIPNTISPDSSVSFSHMSTMAEKSKAARLPAIARSSKTSGKQKDQLHEAVFNISGENYYAYAVTVTKTAALTDIKGKAVECKVYPINNSSDSFFSQSKRNLTIRAAITTNNPKAGVYTSSEPVLVCINLN